MNEKHLFDNPFFQYFVFWFVDDFDHKNLSDKESLKFLTFVCFFIYNYVVP